jgi:sugar lactone lactonase YvrE
MYHKQHMKKSLLLILALFIAPILYGQVVVSTLQSSSRPRGVAIDLDGNIIVAELGTNSIKRITPAGVISTVASQMNGPWGVVVDANGNIFVSHLEGRKISKITTTGVVSTFAGGVPGDLDGTGTDARFGQMTGLTMDNAGNIYVADWENKKLKKITSSGVVTTIAGSGSSGSQDGTGTGVSFYLGWDVEMGPDGNIYWVDFGNGNIRKCTPTGIVTTFVSGLSLPTGMCFDGVGDAYVVEWDGNRVKKITPSGVITIIAGSGADGTANGTGTDATFRELVDIAVDRDGNLYATDFYADNIRKITGAAAPALPLQAYFRTSNFDGYAISGAGNADGEIQTLILGGQAPYSYSWTGPGRVRGANPSGLGEGVYYLEVTDDLGEMVRIGPMNLVAKP